MAAEIKHVMELCEICQKPIGYSEYVSDGSGSSPIHITCLDEADLNDRGYMPAGKMLRSTTPTIDSSNHSDGGKEDA